MGWQDAPIVDAPPAAVPAWQSAPEVSADNQQGGLPVITDDGSNWNAPKGPAQPGLIQRLEDAWNSPGSHLTSGMPAKERPAAH